MRFSPISVWLSLLGATAEAASLAPRAQGADRFDMSLDWNFFGFLSSIKLGTPQVEYAVFVDWTWISQFVLSSKCYGVPQNASACLNSAQVYYEPSKSSSVQNRSSLYPSRTWLPNHFFFWEPLTVDYASDIVTVGPVTSETIIQVSDTTFDLTTFPFPFSGVFGLSPIFKGDNGTYFICAR
jgi:hypothetical protein